MDLKARHKLVDEILHRIGTAMHAIAEEAPEYWQGEEYEWLAARVAQRMTNDRREVSLRRRSFNHTIRQKRVTPK